MICLKCPLISFSVLDTFGGDQGKERILFLAPSLGSKATLIGEISGKSWGTLNNVPVLSNFFFWFSKTNT